MILLHLTAPQWNARFAKTFHGQARGVVQSGFDEYFFEGRPGTEGLPVIPKDFIDSTTEFLIEHGDDRAQLEFIACMIIKNGIPPMFLGKIVERQPGIGRWLLEMIERQRKIVTDFLALHDLPGHPTKPPPDPYTPYLGACHAAIARLRGHDLLGEME